MPVPVLVTVTFAFGTIAPDGSVTDPVMVPVSNCANAAVTPRIQMKSKSAAVRPSLDVELVTSARGLAMVCLAFRADRVDGLAAGESTGYYVYDKPQSIFFLHYLYQNGRNFCFF